MVGIILFQNMRYAPFLRVYEKLLNEAGINYEVIYYNRVASLNEKQDEQYISIPWYGKGTVAAPAYEKLLNFIAYRVQLLRILKAKKYDFLIILTTFPSVLIVDYLSKKYVKKYIVDIRDYTKEGFSPYYKAEQKIMKASALNVISSAGFVHFLPKADYHRIHNISDEIDEMDCLPFIRASGRPIIISYIGSILYEKQCKQLIDLVAQDDRFEFHLYGNDDTGGKVSEYAIASGCDRIKIMGPFLPSQKRDIYSKSDLVFNCYGNDNMLVKYAISNKYYDGAFFATPILVSPSTAMAEESGRFAFPLDLGVITSLDELFSWYKSLDATSYQEFAHQVVATAKKENRETIAKIVETIRKVQMAENDG